MKTISLFALMNAAKTAGVSDSAMESLSIEQAKQIFVVGELKRNVECVLESIVKSAVDEKPMAEESTIDLLSNIDHTTVTLIGSLGVTRTQVQKATTNKITSANKAKAEALKPKVKVEVQTDIEQEIASKSKAKGKDDTAE